MSGPTLRIKKDVVPATLLAALRAKLREGRWVVRVGLPDSENEKDSGLTLAQLGTIHEYGTANIPPRPFMQVGIRLSQDAIRAVSKAALTGVIRGRLSIAEGLAFVGTKAVAGIVKVLNDGSHLEPLKQSTIDRKGSSKPLIDTAQLKQSLTYVVTSREGAHAV